MNKKLQFNLKAYIEEKRIFIEKEIKKALLKNNDHPLEEIYSYCMGYGKLFRPILVVASGEACGISQEKVLPSAISIEMIHNFSLIHDDLPCMDDDTIRRGKPSCHIKFGQPKALLAGDGLLIYAFNYLTKNADIPGIDPKNVIRVINLYSMAAGHKGMTGGQVLDIEYQDAPSINKDILKKIHAGKTAALITAAVMAGGILAGAPEEKINSLKIYGNNIGLTYQIIDDLLDIDEDKETISFPAVFGIKESKTLAKEATEKALEALKTFDSKADPLRELSLFLLNRKK